MKTTKTTDPPADQMPPLEQLAGLKALDTAADIFEGSPKETFTRAEVVRVLRGLKSELFDADCTAAYEIALLDMVDLSDLLPLSNVS